MDAPDQPDDGSNMELVMPFVVCTPAGPYDSSAFVAGAEMASIHDDLRTLTGLRNGTLTAARYEKYVAPELVPQLDLVAMHHGFTLTTTPWDEHPDEWVLAVFEYAPAK